MKLYSFFWLSVTVLGGISCAENSSVVEESNNYILNIDVDESIPDDEKIPMILTQTFQGQSIVYEGRIERRGGFSISYPKQY